METTTQVIPIFNGEAYSFWKIKMKTILKTRKLWDMVESGVPAIDSTSTVTPEKTKQQEGLILKDMMALQILQTAVSDVIFPRIAPATSSKDAWDALEMEFQGSAQVKLINLQSLRREYENLKMSDRDSIHTFTTRLIDMGNQLRIHGEEKSDYQIVQKILISLPEKFDSIVAVLEQTKDLNVLSVTELIGTLKAHEKRVELREERSTEGAFYGEKIVSKGRNKSEAKHHEKTDKWCGVCERNNHNESECWSKKKGVKDERKCFVCNEPGHLAKNCRLRKTESADLSIEETKDDSGDEGHMLFSAIQEETSLKEDDETWLVDSGCTNHMIKEASFFITLDKNIKIPIKMENGQRVITAGKGNIQVMTSQGEKIIKEVFLVPDLARNMLSVSQLVLNGYGVLFKANRCFVDDPQGRRILKIEMKHKMFPFKWNESEANSLFAHEVYHLMIEEHPLCKEAVKSKDGRIVLKKEIAADLDVPAAEEAIRTKGKKVTNTRKTKGNVVVMAVTEGMAVNQGGAKKLKKTSTKSNVDHLDHEEVVVSEHIITVDFNKTPSEKEEEKEEDKWALKIFEENLA